MKEIIRYGFILGLICFLASGILAAVNGVTQPQIKAQREKEENLALKKAMPEVAVFKPCLQDEKVLYYLAYDARGTLKGFVIKSEGKGYSSDIQVLTGLTPELEIINIEILSQNETPGLGSRVTEPAFGAQFKGKNLDSFSEIQAITGATISSGAVIDSVKDKILELKSQLLKEAGLAR